MNSRLKKLFEFELVITEMQLVLTELIKNKSSKETIDKAIKRVDDLIAIKNEYDSFYFSSEYWHERYGKSQYELMEARNKILELKEENEKLLKSLEWN
jgi:hypothetical protein